MEIVETPKKGVPIYLEDSVKDSFLVTLPQDKSRASYLTCPKHTK